MKLGDLVYKNFGRDVRTGLTVIGTPYYMSPEVCSNKPYSFESDMRALGCIVYEMCTLKRAFHSNNLLGLVYKIVQETYEDIPTMYDGLLREIVNSLLSKVHHNVLHPKRYYKFWRPSLEAIWMPWNHRRRRLGRPQSRRNQTPRRLQSLEQLRTAMCPAKRLTSGLFQTH